MVAFSQHGNYKMENNMKAMREAIDGIKNTANSALTALSIGNDTSSFLWNIIRQCDTALASSPRACDLMTEEELSRVVSRSIVASVSSRPELNEEWIKSLVGAAVTAAIKSAYDTQLKSNKESNYDETK